ncbi:unnamed protein product, partial [marine sediment metagenome]
DVNFRKTQQGRDKRAFKILFSFGPAFNPEEIRFCKE